MFKKKSKTSEKVVPFAAGAGAMAVGVAGVVAAKALSDKKNRAKVVKTFTKAKKQAMNTVSDVVEKRGEMLDMVKEKAGAVMSKKAEKKAPRKVKVTKKSSSVSSRAN